MYHITIEKSTGNYYTIMTEDETMIPRVLNLAQILNSEGEIDIGGTIDIGGVRFYNSASDTWGNGRIFVPVMFLSSIDIIELGNGGEDE